MMFRNILYTTLVIMCTVHASPFFKSEPEDSEPCEDIVGWCEAFKIYCIYYKGFMHSRCRKTCGFCSVEPSSLRPTTLPATSQSISTVVSTSAKPTSATTQQTSTTSEPDLTTVQLTTATIGPTTTTIHSTTTAIHSTTTTIQPTPKTEICGVRSVHHRIVGGIISGRNAWPWMAQIATTREFVFCGGSLISSEWVVTAAHCVLHRSPSGVVVRLGAHFREQSKTIGSEQTFSLSKIIIHPDYDAPLPQSNDIALLKLSRPASINKKVSPVCVPTENSPLGFSPNKTCRVTGWGHVKFLGRFADQLMQAKVPIKSNSTCRTSYPRLIDNSMVCAGPSRGGIDACQGDSGGPLVCSYSNRWYLEGVVSWGHGCAAPGKFGVYSKVRHLNNWLRGTMKGN